MKILHLLTSINTGGAEKFCVDICNTQANISEHEIYLCVLDKLGNQPLVKNIATNVTLISLDKEGGYSLKVIYKIYKTLRKLNPDVIHLNGRALIYASLPILIKRIPSVYTVHTFANKEYNKYLRKFVRLLFNKMPSLFIPVAIGRSVSESVRKTYGNMFDRYIYNGSSSLGTTVTLDSVKEEISLLKYNSDTLVFVSIGRIAPEKNTLLLIKAFNKLLREGKNICLYIIGYDSTKSQTYMAECQELSEYHEKIKFVGQKENVADYLYCSDALCLTSNYEGLGIAALEAFSMGVPVLSTPSGGPEDIIISGVNGLVSQKISVGSFVETVHKFIDQPIRNKEEIINIYENHYTMEVCAKQYLQLYTDIKKQSI